jgi:hypothetical protein
MRQRTGGSIQEEQSMKEVFARISLQFADFHRILQAMRPSGRRIITGLDRDAKSEWEFAARDVCGSIPVAGGKEGERIW